MYAGFAGMTMSLSWIQYFTHQIVGLVYFAVVFFLLERLCRPKEPLNGKAYFVEQYASLGKASTAEKKSSCYLYLIIGHAAYHKLASHPGHVGICDRPFVSVPARYQGL